MTRRIKNFDALASTPARTDALEVIEAAYDAIDSEKAIRAHVKLDGSMLAVGDESIDLSKREHVYIVGCGKVACQAAAALENILRAYVKDGAVIGVTNHACDIVTTYQGTHPLPSSANFAASDHMLRIGNEVTERDLVLAIIGGGGSALLCSSQSECDQSSDLYNAFLTSGGTIDELNIVRRHLSPLKGGGLAKVLYPAEVIGLIFSDVVGGDLRTVASGPTYRDDTTIADAQALIGKYSLGSYALVETPKDDTYFQNVRNVLIVSNDTALRAMNEKARSLGYEVATPGCDPYGTPESVLQAMEAVATPGSIVVFGGEPRLAVSGGGWGRGGRNTYMALISLETLRDGQVFASFASDGIDNSEAAGAITDLGTKQTLRDADVPIEKRKKEFDTNIVFEKSGDLIMTGVVESNVSDLALLLTPRHG
ncbi:DUF4147 domain-containing protein [Candidatus Kaiserbacteria bacterium]|nr:DUF4147 domain-containing protein [Candidatus Kaiserbacteria bacterium]